MKDISPVRLAAVELLRLGHTGMGMHGDRVFGRLRIGFEAPVP